MPTFIAAAFAAAMVFPFLAATIVAWLPGSRPDRKVLFVIVSVILAAGLGSLLEVVLLIIITVISYFWPGWPSESYAILPLILEMSDEYGVYVVWAIELLLGIAVPVTLRRKMWVKLIQAFA